MRKKRKSEQLLLYVLLLTLLIPPVCAADTAPATSAVSVILVEQESGTVLFSHEAERPLPIASITKIMTGLLAVERCDPEAKVVIRAEWLGTEGSNMGLRAGEVRTVEELLYGLLLVSGNDAAVALACYMAGDLPSFARWMNARANELGMKDSCFLNPHGLPQDGHRSTARDMAILACTAMKNDRFSEIAGCRSREIGGAVLRNHNRLLWNYSGALGVKTGYTEASGRTLVSCARRDGMTLVCVTLNDPEDWKDHAALLDWGFSTFTLEQTENLTWSLPVISGKAEQVTLFAAEKKGIPVPKARNREWRAELPPFIYAPCERGEELGRAVLYADGEPIYSCPLLAEKTVPVDESQRLNLWERLCRLWCSACCGW